MADLKLVYQAATEEEGKNALIQFKEKRRKSYPKTTNNKPSFTNDDSLKKMLYLASKKIVEHWTARCRNWDMVLNQLNILFQDRIAG